MRYHWLVKRARSLIASALVIGMVVIAGMAIAQATVTFQEASLALAPGEIRTLSAQTPFGVPLRNGVTWSVAPSWLGKMDERGGFHAGEGASTEVVDGELVLGPQRYASGLRARALDACRCGRGRAFAL